ncbi:helix-turn-helix domain-containing protein [Streptomyces sp. ISL-87]|nr:helix-turn-helix domain-containing protein [Streptomyces sp. ISL-21]MBT2607767.1 helix-turn-helix domain-containing protein [Streptomyces sp. ISL-87]
MEERLYIADQVWANAAVRRIAADLGRSPSTISREIRRNRHPTNGQYRPHAAQARADPAADHDQMRALVVSVRRIPHSPDRPDRRTALS